MSPLDQYLPQMLQHPLHRAMGVRDIRVEPGRAVLEVKVDEQMVNPAGMFHGGIVYTLCDMVCYAALVAQLKPGENAATHDLHVSVMKAARIGDTVRFEGRVLRAGRSVAFMESQALLGDQLLARATVTKSILRPVD